MSLSPTIELARDLIRIESVTPNDNGCQEILKTRLRKTGFSCEQLNFHDVQNLWATHGDQKPLLVFAGHTDVVPTGPPDQWTHPPFDAVIENDMLHGRGAADMKGSIASFLVACEQFVDQYPEHTGSIGLLITSDEEGVARWGTREVISTLSQRQQQIDYCIVGEPTSVNKVGDMAKIGRRGSLNATLIVKGKQGHIAYPHQAINPIHTAIPALHALQDHQWDQGNENFQPSRFQMSNINGGTGATNVIPGEIEVKFNFRYSPETTAQEIISTVERILTAQKVEFEIQWGEPGLPFETKTGEFVNAVSNAIKQVCDIHPELSTNGGTSDGRFIAPTGTQVVELGPVNATIHQIDEQICVSDLDLLTRIYLDILVKMLKD